MTDTPIIHGKRVFLSYSHADSIIAHRIANRIQSANLPIWFDQWDLGPGDLIARRLGQAGAASSVLVLIFSYAASLSMWVRREANAGFRDDLRTRAIAPLLVRLDDAEIPPALRDLYSVDLRPDFESAMRALVQSIRSASKVDLSQLDPRSFESLVADLLRSEGYEVRPVSGVQDVGFDFVAMPRHNRSASLRERLLVECKHRGRERVGVAALHQLTGAVARSTPSLSPGPTSYLLALSGQLTSVARNYLAELLRTRPLDLRVMDGTEVVQLLLQKPELVERYFGRDVIA